MAIVPKLKSKWKFGDTGLGSAANTVIPANAGIQGTMQNVLSWTPAYAGVTEDVAASRCAN